jgi:hypothetical protein
MSSTKTYHVYRSGNNTEPVKRALESRGWESVDDAAKLGETWTANFIWKPTWTKEKPPPSLFARQHSNPNRRQVYNHLRATEPLCEKDSLFETMRAYYTAVKEDPFQRLPPTYLVEPKMGGNPNTWPGWSEFADHFARCDADPSLKNLWLVKPTSANRGIGIEVFSTISQIKDFLDSKARGAAMGIKPIWVLQKYIENPLLYNGRKFDLRVWVVALDNGDVYMYAPGYVRTSSEGFDLSSDNRYAHLTNYCQQVLNKDSFGKFEEGNTLKFSDLEDYMTETICKSLTSSTKRKNQSVSSSDQNDKSSSKTTKSTRSIDQARSGIELMWGCGKEGLWGQMRATLIDCFSALQGRGGHRSCGYEENGYARKPPSSVYVPSRGSGAKGESVRKAGEQGTRHRFELLGLDFMVDLDGKIHFIEVNTNPSLSYQNSWHEGFVDDMVDKLLDLVMADAWPESTDEQDYPDSDPPADALKRPPIGWQHVMNVYTSQPKHTASLALQAAADLMRSRGGGRLYSQEAEEGKERVLTKASGGNLGFGTSAPRDPSGSSINRTVNLAAAKLLSAASVRAQKSISARKAAAASDSKSSSINSSLNASKNTLGEEEEIGALDTSRDVGDVIPASLNQSIALLTESLEDNTGSSTSKLEDLTGIIGESQEDVMRTLEPSESSGALPPRSSSVSKIEQTMSEPPSSISRTITKDPLSSSSRSTSVTRQRPARSLTPNPQQREVLRLSKALIVL